MNFRGKKDIRVFNECPFQVNLVGQRRDYIFPPCENGEPTMNFVDFDEIEYAHSRGKLFTTGLLIFDESDQEDMYSTLGIKDWKDKVWFNKDIEDAILNPSVEKMQRIIDVKDTIVFERIRGMMVRFVNEQRDVSQNVIKLINARFKELNAGNYTSKIKVRASDTERPVLSNEVEDLKRQNEELQKMMKQMMEQMAKMKSDNTDVAEEGSDVEPERESVSKTNTTRKSGRKASVIK